MNRHHSYIVSLLVWSAVILLMASCASRKKTIVPPASVKQDSFVAKFSADISGQGMELNDVSGQFRVCRDSIMWLSASAFAGIESIRAMATNDSVFLINRIDKTYLAESIRNMAPLLQDSVSLQDLQHNLFDKGTGEPVYLQFGPYKAILHYESIVSDTTLTFPFKINSNYKRIIL